MSTSILVQASSDIPSIPDRQLAASIEWLIDEWYGRHLKEPMLRPVPEANNWKCKITLKAVLDGFKLHSQLITPDDISHSRRSWLPLHSISSITTTAAADCFQLWSETQQYPYLQNLQPAPKQTSTLRLQALSRLIQQPISAADIRMVTTSKEGVLILLPDGPLALSPNFGITDHTIMWLTWRNNLERTMRDWRTLHVMNDSRLVLEPSSGPLMLVDPNTGNYTRLDKTALIEPISSLGIEGLTLLTVSTSGIAVWYRPGLLVVQKPTEKKPYAHSLKIPIGSILPSAATSDGNGDIWLYDPNERRIRVFSLSVDDNVALSQAFSITPMVPKQELSDIQTMSITSDNHILLGSRRAIWKLDYRGIPRWVLRLVNEQPRQSLPQAFSISGYFSNNALVLLDRTSGSLYRFDKSTSRSRNSHPPHFPHIESLKVEAISAELARKALFAAENMWKKHYPLTAQYLLGTANQYLNKWRASNPIAPGINEIETAIEKFSDDIDHGLFGKPLFEIEITPDIYYPELSEFYRKHPFILTLKNRRNSVISGTVELGLAGTVPALILDPITVGSENEISIPVILNPNKKHFQMSLSNNLLLWLQTKITGHSRYILTPTSLSLMKQNCIPEAGLKSVNDFNPAKFLQSKLSVKVNEPFLMPMQTGELIKQLALLAKVINTVPACGFQSVSQTLKTLSGTGDDWALALAVILSSHQVPVALLLGPSGSTIVLVQAKSDENSIEFADFELDITTVQQLSSGLKKMSHRFNSDPVWALQPHSVEPRVDVEKKWLSSGLEEIKLILQQKNFAWRFVRVQSRNTEMPLSKPSKTINWPIILPLGSVNYTN